MSEINPNKNKNILEVCAKAIFSYNHLPYTTKINLFWYYFGFWNYYTY